MRDALATPRPAPGRLVPAVAGAATLALALPVFLVAGFPLGGWAIAAVLWLAGHALELVLTRLQVGAGNLAASGVVGIGRTLRTVAVGIVLIAVAASNTEVGVAAAVLYAVVFTLELGVSLGSYFGAAR